MLKYISQFQNLLWNELKQCCVHIRGDTEIEKNIKLRVQKNNSYIYHGLVNKGVKRTQMGMILSIQKMVLGPHSYTAHKNKLKMD